MSEAEFQRHVTDSLARLETKMDLLVGDDGAGGRLAQMDAEIESLKRHRWRQSGALSIIGGLVGAAITGLTEYFSFRHF